MKNPKLSVVAFERRHAERLFEEPQQTQGLSVADLIDSYLSEGSQAVTLLCDDEPIACGGIMNLGWNRGEAWILTRSDVGRYGKSLIKICRYVLPRMAASGGFRRVQATCFGKTKTHLFEILGFTYEGLLKSFGPQGENMAVFAQVYGGV